MLLFILILLFILLICYQIFLACFKHSKIVEGMSAAEPVITAPYIPSAATSPAGTEVSSDTTVMVQRNAGNIEYLKQRMDAVQNMYTQVRDLSGNVTTVSNQVNGLAQAQQEYVAQLTPPEISGTE